MSSHFRTALLRVSRPGQQLRFYSQQRPKSATGEFYKQWTRPVAKTALLAVFTYQLIYWGWSKLEFEEVKETKQAEITRLEALVKLEQQKQKQMLEQEQEQEQQKQQNNNNKNGDNSKKGGWLGLWSK